MIVAVYRTKTDSCGNKDRELMGHVEDKNIESIEECLPQYHVFYGWELEEVVTVSIAEINRRACKSKYK